MLTVAETIFDASVVETASTVTVWVVGKSGAVKKPLESIVPVLATPPGTPFTRQVTGELAVNCMAEPLATLTEVGEIVNGPFAAAELLLPPPQLTSMEIPHKAKNSIALQ
jgi:hypothetical protein